MKMEVTGTLSGPIVDSGAEQKVDLLVSLRMDEARQAAKQAIRDGAPERKGELRESIQVQGESVVTECDHAPFVEFGHIQGKTNPTAVPPHPFFFVPGVEESATAVVAHLSSDIVNELG